jgi:hypothetical protein
MHNHQTMRFTETWISDNDVSARLDNYRAALSRPPEPRRTSRWETHT